MLKNISETGLGEAAWLQATLPVKMGGFRAASTLALPFFRSSFNREDILIDLILSGFFSDTHSILNIKCCRSPKIILLYLITRHYQTMDS